MINPPSGPTLLGVDVILVGSILAGIAAAAMMYAIYTAITVRDPMSKRVKALNGVYPLKQVLAAMTSGAPSLELVGVVHHPAGYCKTDASGERAGRLTQAVSGARRFGPAPQRQLA